MPVFINCYVCSKAIKVKPSYLKRVKNPDRICCSVKCSKLERSERMIGEGNHQHGLIGPVNSSFKVGVRISNYGYRVIYKPEHPTSSSNGYIKEHRYIAETELQLDPTNYYIVDGIKCLKDGLDVHHKDGDKLNNDPSNLMVLTRSEHTKLHNKMDPMLKDPITGRFISRG